MGTVDWHLYVGKHFRKNVDLRKKLKDRELSETCDVRVRVN